MSSTAPVPTTVDPSPPPPPTTVAPSPSPTTTDIITVSRKSQSYATFSAVATSNGGVKTTSTASSATRTTSPPASNNGGGGSLSSGSTVGLTIGIIGGAILLAIVAIYVFRKKGLKPSSQFRKKLDPLTPPSVAASVEGVKASDAFKVPSPAILGRTTTASSVHTPPTMMIYDYPPAAMMMATGINSTQVSSPLQSNQTYGNPSSSGSTTTFATSPPLGNISSAPYYHNYYAPNPMALHYPVDPSAP